VLKNNYEFKTYKKAVSVMEQLFLIHSYRIPKAANRIPLLFLFLYLLKYKPGTSDCTNIYVFII
jgi:hypothetical protein